MAVIEASPAGTSVRVNTPLLSVFTLEMPPAVTMALARGLPLESVTLPVTVPVLARPTGLTNSFGRLDGTITAVVRPSDTSCALPNSDHLVVQLQVDGGIYRVVVNVKSTGPDPDVRFRTVDAALKAGAWQEGWHVGVSLDYPGDLDVHTDGGFRAVPMNALVNEVTGQLELGTHLSAFSSSSGGANASSSHLVHRNGGGHDGALVLDPDGPAPRYLLFHFPEQTF